jgi:arylsulfatase A-like enzyme
VNPNIVVYISHDTGQHIGPCGVKTVYTTNADRVAAEGALLVNSLCTAPQRSPFRAGLFTGRYPHATGVLGLTDASFGWTMNPNETHMAAYPNTIGYDGFDGCASDDSLGVTVPPYLNDSPGTRTDFAALQGSVRRWDEAYDLGRDPFELTNPVDGPAILGVLKDMRGRLCRQREAHDDYTPNAEQLRRQMY